jgi:hypothetical protein
VEPSRPIVLRHLPFGTFDRVIDADTTWSLTSVLYIDRPAGEIMLVDKEQGIVFLKTSEA